MSHTRTKAFWSCFAAPLKIDVAGKRVRYTTLILALAGLMSFISTTGCGGGAAQNIANPPLKYTVGVNVSGLAGSGLVLENNGGNDLPVSSDGLAVFTAALESGTPYNVTVASYPGSPTQTCAVAMGTGTVTSSNVTSVLVKCEAGYTVGGSVLHLPEKGGGLRLMDNGNDSLLVSANGGFTFPTPLASGSSYSVTGEGCQITNGAGVATTNVSNVAVDCAHNEWIWIDGPNVINQTGSYGTQGSAAPSSVPGGRLNAVSWTDKAGNFWLFGGTVYEGQTTVSLTQSVPHLEWLNDLWEYSDGQWTWMSGSDLPKTPMGIYGTLGTPGPENTPGGRTEAARWTDSARNLWLFGGIGSDSTGAQGNLNDLWKYSAGQWTWMGGSNVIKLDGNYGALGVPAPSNTPGARYDAMTWTDPAGDFWLFGGALLSDPTRGTIGVINDLWKYSGGQWTWMGGSNTVNQNGSYGTLRIADPNNVPPAREGAATWIDLQGNLWLFGGVGPSSPDGGGGELLSDLWKYSAGEWTWFGGSNVGGQFGIYGTQGVPDPRNIPGSRVWATSWTDAAGNFWLFGGSGLDGGESCSSGEGGNILNDLWKYRDGQWTWISGSTLGAQLGNYGAQGAPAPSNVPGARLWSASWIDATGNLWLFGGQGIAAQQAQPLLPKFCVLGVGGFLNDLWEYEP